MCLLTLLIVESNRYLNHNDLETFQAGADMDLNHLYVRQVFHALLVVSG